MNAPAGDIPLPFFLTRRVPRRRHYPYESYHLYGCRQRRSRNNSFSMHLCQVTLRNCRGEEEDRGPRPAARDATAGSAVPEPGHSVKRISLPKISAGT
jgi:hypothetical protein